MNTNKEDMSCEKMQQVNELPEETEQLSSNLEDKLLEILGKSNLGDLLYKSGILSLNAIEVEIKIQGNKLQPRDTQGLSTTEIRTFSSRRLCSKPVPCPDDPSRTCWIKVDCTQV